MAHLPDDCGPGRDAHLPLPVSGGGKGVVFSGLVVAVSLARLQVVLLPRRLEVAVARSGIAHVPLALALIVLPFAHALGRARVGLDIVGESRGTGAENESCRESHLDV